jgi:hypothetical protein
LRIFSIWVLGFVCLAPLCAAAEEPAAQAPDAATLVAWLPDDVGLLVQMLHLGRDAAAFDAGELARRIEAFPAFSTWESSNRAGLEGMTAQLESVLGVSVDELLKSVLGQQVVVAIWPQTAGAKQPPVVVLIEASDAELLGRVFDRLISTVQSQGVAIEADRPFRVGDREVSIRRLPTDDGGSLYCSILGSVGVIANHELTLERVLQRQAGLPVAGASLADSRPYRRAAAVALPQASIRMVLNPRPWDEQIRAEVSRAASPAELEPVRAATWQAWQALEFAVGAIELGDTLRVEVFAGWNSDQLPEPIRVILQSAGGPAQFADSVPANALAAAAGRFDPGQFVPRVGANPSAREGDVADSLARIPGWRAMETVLRNLGPEGGAFISPVAPPEAGSRPAWQLLVPIEWAASLEIATPKGESPAPFVARFDALLRSAVSLAVAIVNLDAGREVVAVETIDVDGTSVTSVDGVGVLKSPLLAFAIVEDRVWAASSRDAVLRSARRPAEDSLGRSEAFRALQSPTLADPSHWIYINFAACRELIASMPYLESLVTSGAGASSELERNWRELLALLELADAIVVTARVDKDGVAISAAVSATPR